MKGYKTVIFGLLIALTSVLSNADMQAFVGEHLPYLGGLVGTMIVILRAVTSSPVFQKDENNVEG